METRAADGIDDETAWRLVLVDLLTEVETMADEFVAELKARGTYHHGLIDDAHLRDTARLSLGALVDLLLHRSARGGGAASDVPDAPGPARVRAVAEELGRSRAHRGVPVETLLEAVRLDFVVLWRHLRERAGRERAHLLVERTEDVLATVELYLTQVQRAFFAETARRQQDARLATERIVHLLLDDQETDEATLHALAQDLGVEPDAQFEAVLSSEADAVALEEALAPLLHRGRAWGHRRGALFCGLGVAGGSGPSLADAASDVGCLLLPRLHGPAALRAAVHGAEQLMASLPALDRPRTVEQVWEHGAAAWFATTAPDVVAGPADELLALPAAELARLVQTVQRYLETGSVKDTSAQLFCHRNTVVNRLRLFREVTGLDVAIPRQAALAQVVLAEAARRTG